MSTKTGENCRKRRDSNPGPSVPTFLFPVLGMSERRITDTAGLPIMYSAVPTELTPESYVGSHFEKVKRRIVTNALGIGR
jgi:hypothetical protein